MIVETMLTLKMFLAGLLLLPCIICAPYTVEDITTSNSPHPFTSSSLNDSSSTSFPLSTLSNGRLTCYPPSDSLFFSLMNPPNYDLTTCMRLVTRFSRAVVGSESNVDFYYTTPGGRQPLGLSDTAMQMPVFRQDGGCAAAIVSTRLLDQWAKKEGVGWRAEWGNRVARGMLPTSVNEQARDVRGLEGMVGLLECFVEGRPPSNMAGHLLSSE